MSNKTKIGWITAGAIAGLAGVVSIGAIGAAAKERSTYKKQAEDNKLVLKSYDDNRTLVNDKINGINNAIESVKPSFGGTFSSDIQYVVDQISSRYDVVLANGVKVSKLDQDVNQYVRPYLANYKLGHNIVNKKWLKTSIGKNYQNTISEIVEVNNLIKNILKEDDTKALKSMYSEYLDVAENLKNAIDANKLIENEYIKNEVIDGKTFNKIFAEYKSSIDAGLEYKSTLDTIIDEKKVITDVLNKLSSIIKNDKILWNVIMKKVQIVESYEDLAGNKMVALSNGLDDNKNILDSKNKIEALPKTWVSSEGITWNKSQDVMDVRPKIVANLNDVLKSFTSLKTKELNKFNDILSQTKSRITSIRNESSNFINQFANNYDITFTETKNNVEILLSKLSEFNNFETTANKSQNLNDFSKYILDCFKNLKNYELDFFKIWKIDIQNNYDKYKTLLSSKWAPYNSLINPSLKMSYFELKETKEKKTQLDNYENTIVTPLMNNANGYDFDNIYDSKDSKTKMDAMYGNMQTSTKALTSNIQFFDTNYGKYFAYIGLVKSFEEQLQESKITLIKANGDSLSNKTVLGIFDTAEQRVVNSIFVDEKISSISSIPTDVIDKAKKISFVNSYKVFATNYDEFLDAKAVEENSNKSSMIMNTTDDEHLHPFAKAYATKAFKAINDDYLSLVKDNKVKANDDLSIISSVSRKDEVELIYAAITKAHTYLSAQDWNNYSFEFFIRNLGLRHPAWNTAKYGNKKDGVPADGGSFKVSTSDTLTFPKWQKVINVDKQEILKLSKIKDVKYDTNGYWNPILVYPASNRWDPLNINDGGRSSAFALAAGKKEVNPTNDNFTYIYNNSYPGNDSPLEKVVGPGRQLVHDWMSSKIHEYGSAIDAMIRLIYIEQEIVKDYFEVLNNNNGKAIIPNSVYYQTQQDKLASCLKSLLSAERAALYSIHYHNVTLAGWKETDEGENNWFTIPFLFHFHPGLDSANPGTSHFYEDIRTIDISSRNDINAKGAFEGIKIGVPANSHAFLMLQSIKNPDGRYVVFYQPLTATFDGFKVNSDTHKYNIGFIVTRGMRWHVDYFNDGIVLDLKYMAELSNKYNFEHEFDNI